MTLAVKGVVKLFQRIKREDEVSREALAFSVSHDNRTVRIYAHYAVIDGDEVKFWHSPIRKFDFTEQDGREKWTAYKFIRGVYEKFVPMHLERLRSAIDQLPPINADDSGFYGSQQSISSNLQENDN